MNGKYIISDFLNQDIPISQNYGENVEYYKNFTSGALQHGHEGVDFKTENGTPIYAPFDGIIVRDTFSAKDYGLFIVIWDPIQCCALWFCHMLDSSVKINDHVKAGDLLGHTDNTGNTSGPHCHVNFVETDVNGIRLHMANGEEGFLNLMDQTLVNYPWNPCAAKGSVVTPQVPDSHYKAGDEIKIDTDVATGASPQSINFSYGKIGKDAPAKVIEVVMSNGFAYYHIDQTYIGGGTGFAYVLDVDAHVIQTEQASVLLTPVQPTQEVKAAETVTPQSVVTPEITPCAPIVPPVAPSVDTLAVETDPQKRIATLVVQNNDLLGKLKEMADKYKLDLENYMGILALGYEKADDILKAIEEVTKDNAGIKKHMGEVLKSSEDMALVFAAKCKEDATAIEVGMKYESLYNNARNELVAIAKAFKTKPSMVSILAIADRLRTAYDNAIKQLQKKQTQDSIKQAVNTIETTVNAPVNENGFTLLERLLTFNFKGGAK